MQRDRPGPAAGIDRVAVTARRLGERDLVACRARGLGVVAGARGPTRSRRRPRARAPTGTPSGMRRIGSACAQRSGTCAGSPPSSSRAACPARARSQTAAIASTRCTRDGRRRTDGAWRKPGAPGRPQRELAARGVAEHRHAVEVQRPVVEPLEVIDRRRDILEGLRPAAALLAEPPVLDVQRDVAAPREVQAQRAHDEARVGRLPVAAVQHDDHRVRPAADRRVQVGDLARMLAVVNVGGRSAQGRARDPQRQPRHPSSPGPRGTAIAPSRMTSVWSQSRKRSSVDRPQAASMRSAAAACSAAAIPSGPSNVDAT